MQSLIAYARQFENEKPDMTIDVALNKDIIGHAAFKEDSKMQPVTVTHDVGTKDLGTQPVISLTKSGTGRLYHTMRLHYAENNDGRAVNSGMDLTREYSIRNADNTWRLVKAGDALRRGDVLRVDLFLHLPSARNFIMINDPIAGGMEIVNRQLATSSSVDAQDGDYTPAGGSLWMQFNDWRGYAVSRWSFYHHEFRHDGARFYSDYLPAGRYHLSYTAQVIADGLFKVPSAKAEALYDPDVFSMSAPRHLRVKAQ